MALPMCSYEGCREYVDRVDEFCPVHQPPLYDGTVQCEQRIKRHWDAVKQAEADRAARIARVDETARALFAHTDVNEIGVSTEESARWCYERALALERARDKAIKEIQ